MNRFLIAALVLVHGSTLSAHATELPVGEVQLQPARWRTTRQIVKTSAEQAGFRWSMPDTLSRRAWSGSGDAKVRPAADILRDLGKETGLTVESINGIVVIHLPNERQRNKLAALKADTDARVRRQALCELGWLGDARAWPELARAVASEDVATALAAAQALRRFEGEKALDWRLHGVSADDPELTPLSEPIPAWQVPFGEVFPDTVSQEAVERLAASRYIPLREAAARLAVCRGRTGKALVTKLRADPSPLVRAAAERSSVAWAELQKEKPQPRKRDEANPWYTRPVPDLKAAAAELAQNKDHDTVWRLTGRRVAFAGTPEAIAVMVEYGRSGGRWNGHVARPLAEWCGGPDVINWLRLQTEDRTLDGRQGWGLWGLTALQDGAELARSLKPALEARAYWAAPPEYTAAQSAGIYVLQPLLGRIDTRGHWVCHALGHIGGPEATDALLKHLDDKDPGVAVAAAKGLGEAAAYAGIEPLLKQLQHPERLRRHWAVLGLGRIGGPEAAKGLTQLLVVEEKRQDRLVRKAAAELLKEMGPLSDEARKLIARVEADDKALVPEYRPRNPKFGADFPVNQEVVVKEHKALTYCSIGETRAAFDWANRLLIRYGGCTPCYSDECFAFDVGSSTWFPLRAADHYCHLFNEQRPNAGCTRGMTYDDRNKWVWIGQGIGAYSGPTAVTHNHSTGLAAYDAALDRFYPCTNAPTMAKAYSGEPAKFYAFDADDGLVLSSASGGKGIGVLDVTTRKTALRPAPETMPSWDQYRPPAFAYDPVAKLLLCTHPDVQWKLLRYDVTKNSYQLSEERYPGSPSKQIMGGLVYDSLNREMLLIGGVTRDTKETMPTCRLERATGRWVDLKTKDLGHLGVGQGTCVYDPEHNIVVELISGSVYRYKEVKPGTKAYYGGGVGER